MGEVQRFAIKQFLSLDPEVLAISIQEELDRENGIVPQQQQFQPQQQQQQFQPQQQQQFQHQQQQHFAPQQQQQQAAPRQLSRADQAALAQQEAALQDSIDLLTCLNFPDKCQ